jgi:hypothetical protein
MFYMQEGNSVLANVTDLMHYLYFPVPDGFTPADLEPLAECLNVRNHMWLSPFLTHGI